MLLDLTHDLPSTSSGADGDFKEGASARIIRKTPNFWNRSCHHFKQQWLSSLLSTIKHCYEALLSIVKHC